MKTTATERTVRTAINAVNQKKGYKLSLHPDSQQQGKYYKFRLKAETGKPGSRLSATGRRLPAASWHAHGYIIDKIFELEPDSFVYSLGVKYTADTWHWKDRNAGSLYSPVMFSDLSIH